MKSRLAQSILGLSSGFLLCLFYMALVIAWPVRALGLALVLGFAFAAIVSRRDGSPLRWQWMAGWFILGCSLAAALLALLDLVFKPLT